MRILVIKLGAFGDFILALGAMKAVREYYKDSEITLLTTKPFVRLAEKTGYFDQIIVDDRPKPWHLVRFARLVKALRRPKFDMVYDFQMNDRTRMYFRIMKAFRKVQWVGHAKGAAYRYDNPDIKKTHPEQKLGALLELTGVAMQKPDASFFNSDILKRENLSGRYAVVMPGSAPHRPHKRWSALSFGKLAKMWEEEGITTVIIGTDHEQREIYAIRQICPSALWFKTNFDDISALAERAAYIVGNDTGPVILAALSGRPTVVLYSYDSSPFSSHPIGARVGYIKKNNINDITPEEVFREIKNLEDL